MKRRVVSALIAVFLILGLALVGFGVLGNPLSTATVWLFDKLFPVAEFAFDLVRKAR